MNFEEKRREEERRGEERREEKRKGEERREEKRIGEEMRGEKRREGEWIRALCCPLCATKLNRKQ
jgi:hypothetical protein